MGVKNHLHIRGVTHKPIRPGEESIKITSFDSAIWGGGVFVQDQVIVYFLSIFDKLFDKEMSQSISDSEISWLQEEGKGLCVNY